MLGALGAVGLALAYAAFPHVRVRIDRFIAPVRGDNSQLDRAYQSFAEGGLLGRGPGEGTIKTVLPDAHTDFVFAVVAEEFGAIACLRAARADRDDRAAAAAAGPPTSATASSATRRSRWRCWSACRR